MRDVDTLRQWRDLLRANDTIIVMAFPGQGVAYTFVADKSELVFDCPTREVTPGEFVRDGAIKAVLTAHGRNPKRVDL